MIRDRAFRRIRATLWPAAALPLAGLLGAGACEARQAGAPAAAVASGDWVGTRYPPLPQGIEIHRGTTLGTADTARYAIAEVSAGGDRLLWLARRAGGDAGPPLWDVTDALELPELGPDRWVVLALCGAPRPGAGTPLEPEDVALDPAIVAIARADEEAVLTAIEHAWRADRGTGRFERVETAGVVCLNEFEPEW
ncbi:MAG TPA: hypothetical protein VF212_03140 [Longimicrobiales bacterium]